MKVESSSRVLLLVGALAIASYFLAFAAGGVRAYFTLDDGLNLTTHHNYWEYSLWETTASALRVVTSAYRPLGGVFYLGIFRLAGFHPLPFRAVCLGLMLANLFVAFRLVERLSGSEEIALLTALLLVYHPAITDLFYSTGTIYDILCFFFYCLALVAYATWREQGQRLGARHLAALLLLYACSLDSKEMAVSLPLALLALELVYHPRAVKL
ncbi:MAG TPA: glycosyltransferase family 39 protein, partial [Bryobacterales bacterium]|nr:glycosyltransferase family 39 protein [Bryobacterales bacterium]